MSDTTDEQDRRERFEREKACYEQNYQHFRAMNQIMWQIPLLAISLTGGLWYAISMQQQSIALFRAPALLLGAALDLALMIVLIRVRYVMGAYLEKLRDFYPAGFVEAAGTEQGTFVFHRRKVVLYAFNTALGFAAACCILGSIYFGRVDLKVW